ncbi:unnamed protein product [Rhizoctonia solani]|uniref:Protein kinase domain-containing protein n=1 Tax=Rhizoctonia solani TaxID=456999 RepID=A0A8H3CN84_9AGAM|nr:unnamed protein product [Rhizoctonia solani]
MYINKQTIPPFTYTRSDVTFAQVAKDLGGSVQLSPGFMDALIAFQQFLTIQEKAMLSKILTRVSKQLEQEPRWDETITDLSIIRKLELSIENAVDYLEDQMHQIVGDSELAIYQSELEKAQTQDRKRSEKLQSIIPGLHGSTNQKLNPHEAVQNLMEENLKVIGNPSANMGQQLMDARKSLAIICELTGKSLSPYTILDGEFVTIGSHAINRGSNYEVFVGEYFTGEKIAIKVLRYRVDKETANQTHKAYLSENWSTLRHDCILSFYGVGIMQSLVRPKEYQLYMVSPYLANQDVMLDIARGLEYMHGRENVTKVQSRGIAHGALNIYNVLVKDSGRVVISGFGHAKASLTILLVIEDFQDDFVGNISEYRYMAPEMLTDAVFTYGSDMWSWAMTSLEILTDEPPFGVKTRGIKIAQMIGAHKRPERANHANVEQYEHGDELWHLFAKCWEPQPPHRPSAHEVVQRLSSIFQEVGKIKRPHVQSQGQSGAVAKPIVQDQLLLASNLGANTMENQSHARLAPQMVKTSSLATEKMPQGYSFLSNSTERRVEDGLGNFAQTGPDVVSSTMQVEEVAALLSQHGYPDISADLDMSVCDTCPVRYGGSADVYSGYLRNGLKVAIKRSRISHDEKGRTFLRMMAKEGYTWSKLRHKNILETCGIAQFKGGIALLAPWMENGTVMEYIRKRPKVDRLKLCAEIASGLSYLHEMETCHGDLKGANVLISGDGVAKLADFGSTSLKHHTLQFTGGTQSHAYTLRWAAPELLTDHGVMSESADVYALGMVIVRATLAI